MGDNVRAHFKADGPAISGRSSCWYAPSPRRLKQNSNPLTALLRGLRNPLESIPAEVFQGATATRKVLGRKLVYVSAPSLFEELLKTRSEEFEKGGVARALYDQVIRSAISNAEGADWRRQRRIIAPIFRPKLLSRFTDGLAASSESYVRQRLAGMGSGPVDLRQFARELTLRNVCNCLFVGLDGARLAEIPKLIEDMASSVPWMRLYAIFGVNYKYPFPRRKQVFESFRRMREITAEYSRSRRNVGEQDTERDLTDALLSAVDPEGGPTFSDTEIVDNLTNLILGGFETTSSVVYYSLIALSQDPALEKAVRDELTCATGGKEITSDSIEAQGLLTRVLMETMRLFPPFPSLWRQPVAKTEIDGIPVNPKDFVQMSVFALHRNECVWEDPLRYDPDRFLPEETEKRHPFSFAGFGAGPRTCPGDRFAFLNAKVMLSTILNKTHFSYRGNGPLRIADHHTLVTSGAISMQFTTQEQDAESQPASNRIGL